MTDDSGGQSQTCIGERTREYVHSKDESCKRQRGGNGTYKMQRYEGLVSNKDEARMGGERRRP